MPCNYYTFIALPHVHYLSNRDFSIIPHKNRSWRDPHDKVETAVLADHLDRMLYKNVRKSTNWKRPPRWSINLQWRSFTHWNGDNVIILPHLTIWKASTDKSFRTEGSPSVLTRNSWHCSFNSVWNWYLTAFLMQSALSVLSSNIFCNFSLRSLQTVEQTWLWHSWGLLPLNEWTVAVQASASTAVTTGLVERTSLWHCWGLLVLNDWTLAVRAPVVTAVTTEQNAST